MKYVVRNEQDLDALLEEQCSGEHEIDSDWEWEGRKEYGSDVIILNAKGKWFDKDIVSRFHIWDGVDDKQCLKVYKIKPEDVPKVKNTISYIRNNFDHIYEVMLEKLLPTLVDWNVQDCETDEPVTTIQQLHKNHMTKVTAGMEAWCITNIQLNCQYQKGDMVVYSLLYRNGVSAEGGNCPASGDGFEVVFWKDQAIFFLDGNTEEQIFDFANYVKWSDCLEKSAK